MTLHKSPVGHANDDQSVPPLELLTDDEGIWTAVPLDATGEQRLTRWISVESEVLCELEAWR